MKIKDMNNKQLLKTIQEIEDNLNNPLWVKRQKRFILGALVYHVGLLKRELIKRGIK